MDNHMMTANISLKKNSGNAMEDLLVDLLNSLSAVKELSELSCQAGCEELLIKQALAALVHNQDMERCSFFRLVGDNVLRNVTGLSYFETFEDEEHTDIPQQFKIGEGIIGLAAELKSLQHCHNSQEDERIALSEKQVKSRLPGSIISVPVFAANLELIGVLNISHPEPYFFSDWHVRLLEIYKNILGQLISNYRLLQQMEQEIANRTTKLEIAFKDIKRLKEHYENMSMLDQLTELYNRRYFYNQVELTMAGFTRYGQSMCLLILDIDHFKLVNDSYGHAFGDQVLKDVANALKQQVRNTDVLVRFGGEEFIIIFTNTSCPNGMIFADRIRKEIDQMEWRKDNFKVGVTMSIGMYCLDKDCCRPDTKPDIDQIIHFADTALYEAKKKGRNRVVMFCEDMMQGRLMTGQTKIPS